MEERQILAELKRREAARSPMAFAEYVGGLRMGELHRRWYEQIDRVLADVDEGEQSEKVR